MYRPSEAAQMRTPLRLQTPVKAVSYAVNKKTWQDADGVIMANFKTYGGTEVNNNGVLSVEDTAQVVCFYRPDITGGCRIVRLTDGVVFEILGVPEDIEQAHQFLKFKVRRVKGGA